MIFNKTLKFVRQLYWEFFDEMFGCFPVISFSVFLTRCRKSLRVMFMATKRSIFNQ